MSWRYFRAALASGGVEYARTDGATFAAEYFDDRTGQWVEQDALYAEIHVNGQYVECTDAEVRA